MTKLIKNPTPTFISLGSNQGNRFDFLQKAVHAVHTRIGQIEKVSRVYQTPSWGFEGNDFLNACIKVKTRFSASVVLQKLLEIEQDFGRIRSQNGYANRTLDLDLLYYGQEIIAQDNLTVPHPRIHQRLFVLKPLCDVAENFSDPVSGKSIQQLLNETEDRAPIKPIDEQLTFPKTDFGGINYLTIEGNIGAGKTSLSTMISQDFNAQLITERFKDNPFLPKFYENQARYAFPLEMSFLADRYQQLVDDIGQYNLFSDFVVSDYDIYKSLIFAEITLAEEEFILYKKLFHIMYKEMAKPDLYVYLFQNTDRLLENIKKRGRTYEQNIPADYLQNIHQGYLQFIKTQNRFKVKIIDVTELDFIANREDYLLLIDTIQSAI